MSEELKKLAAKLATEGPVKVLHTPRQIQLFHNGISILKTTNAHYVWEHAYYPVIYIPHHDLSTAIASNPSLSLTENDPITLPSSPSPIATFLTLQVGTSTPITKILLFPASHPFSSLQNLVKVDFSSIDKWYQESAPIHVHPKDPFKRIEIVPSTRRLQISVRGVPLVDTHSAQHLYETGLPVRFYVPETSVQMQYLKKSETTTVCPYKGTAEYYSVVLGRGEGGEEEVMEDVVWYYQNPTLESAGIADLLCFYNEKVDVVLDGVKQERAQSHMAQGPNAKPPLF